MSYVYRQLSQIDGTNTKWVVPWRPFTTYAVTPPSASDYQIDTGFPSWYLPVDGDIDPTNQFWTAFFTRVADWELNAEGAPDIASLIITATTASIITQPARIDLTGNAQWAVQSTLITKVGGRVRFVDNEQLLPHDQLDPPGESEGSFQYIYNVRLTSNEDPAASIEIEYMIKYMAHEMALQGGVAWIPCAHHYIWTFTDDAGTSRGGFVSHFGDLPTVHMFGTHTIVSYFRLGSRKFGTDEHIGFSFPAFEFTTPLSGAVGPTPSQTVSQTVDRASLELNGVMTQADVWIQPTESLPERYFPYRFNAADETTALYDKDTGHRLQNEPIPLTMTAQ